MTHLGTQLSALADGQLDPASTERALAHVAGCQECADGLAAARAARAALAATFEVRPAADLTARLLALGGAVPGGDQDGRTTAPARAPHAAARRPWSETGSVPLPGTVERLPTGCLHGDLHRSRVPWRALAAVGGGLAAACLGLFVMGGRVDVVPHPHPAHVLTVLARAGETVSATGRAGSVSVEVRSAMLVAAGVPGDGGSASAAGLDGVVAQWVQDHPWAQPVTVPEGYQVAGVRVDPDGRPGLEVDLLGPSGLIVVAQTRGCLDEATLGEPVEVAGRMVHLPSTAPWHAVWQSGDAVLSVAAELASPAADQVVGSYPDRAYDDSVPARIARGWQTLAGAWSGP